MKHSRFWATSLLLLGFVLPTSGCAWLSNRGADARDIFDAKYAFGDGVLGLGAKAEAQLVRTKDTFGGGFGAALGYGSADHVTEYYGRYRISAAGGFYHGGVLGADGVEDRSRYPFKRPSTAPPRNGGHSFSLLGIELWDRTAGRENPWGSGLRVGGELILPWLWLGGYFNAGEFVDLLSGLVGFDLARDDELPDDEDAAESD